MHLKVGRTDSSCVAIALLSHIRVKRAQVNFNKHYIILNIEIQIIEVITGKLLSI